MPGCLGTSASGGEPFTAFSFFSPQELFSKYVENFSAHEIGIDTNVLPILN